MVKYLLPFLRMMNRRRLYYSALRAAQFKTKYDIFGLPCLVFIIGCGRSGTTILGELLSLHPEAHYLFEPFYMWAAVSRQCDVSHFYHTGQVSLIMDRSHCTAESQLRFKRIIYHLCGSQAKLVVEKTPHNAMRIGYIESLAPNSKFIHIVRDGADVAASIDQIARGNSFKVTLKNNYNQWWGRADNKWQVLRRDGIQASYFPDEAGLLVTHLERGAYEWLITLSEVDRWRDKLKGRLFELTYDKFVDHPEKYLRKICTFLGVCCPEEWLSHSNTMVRAEVKTKRKIGLPPLMCKRFNQYQHRYHFRNLAYQI